jgi:leader peptidase (prepilin peptidase)/N-methyltransferase
MSATLVAAAFVWIFGLAIGSFLNVVIYRLPRGLALGRPRRSFCPHCGQAIAWHDNIPVVSWLILRGRCRACRAPISVQYPLVEAATGLVFVLVHHLLFVEHARAGLADPTLPRDLPLLLAWLALVAALIACSAMDIVSYLIDTRVTDAALAAGVILAALWPRSEFTAPLAASAVSAAAVAALIASAVMLRISARGDVDTGDETDAGEAPDGLDAHESPAAPSAPHASPRGGTVLAAAAALLMLGLTGYLLSTAAGVPATPSMVLGVLATLFLLVVIAAGMPRPADADLHEVIQHEQPSARRNTLRELRWLTPIIAAAVAAGLAAGVWPAGRELWSGLASWTTATGLAPVAGAAYAVHGAMIAAAAGWVIRIVFTLALGREAFGIGDIFILSAAGACAGWDIALLGFLLAVPIALAGWILSLCLKRHGMIPFGPPLAIGFVAALWLDHRATTVAREYGRIAQDAWRERPDLVLLGAGLLLVAGAGSLALAKMIRRLAVPEPR